MGASAVKPWERYQQVAPQEAPAGPWMKFQQTSNAEGKGDLQPRPMLPATILPFAKDPYSGDVDFAVPGIVRSAINAVTLPNRVMTGQMPATGPDGNVNPAMVDQAFDMAALPTSGTALGGMARKTLNPATSAQSVDDATQFGVDLTRGQATGRVKDQAFEQDALTGGYGPQAQQNMLAQREAQKQQIQGASDAITNRVSGSRSDDAYEIAENVGQAVKTRSDELKARSQAAYKEAESGQGEIALPAMSSLYDRALKKLDEAGGMEGTAVAPDSPTVRRLIDRIQGLANAKNAPQGAVSVNWQAFEKVRQQINKAKPSGQEQVYMGALKKEMDAWLEDTIQQGLISGDERFLTSFKRARSLWAQHMKFAKNPQQIIRKMSESSADSNQIANWLYGTSKLGGREQSAGVVREIKRLIGDDAPAMDDLRRGVMLRLFENARTGEAKGSTRLANDIRDLVGGRGRELTKALYGPDAVKSLTDFSNVLRKIEPQDLAGNPSRSGQTLMRRLNDIVRVAAPIVGYSVGDFTGLLGGILVAGAGSKVGALKTNRFIKKPVVQLPATKAVPAIAKPAGLLAATPNN